MDKVKITQELADAIDGVKNHADENILYDVTYIKNVCEGEKFDAPKLMPIYNYIQKVGFKEYFKALVVGYEVEETPEEIFKAYIKTIPSTHLETAIKVIDIFNIKIEGVNV